MTLLEKARANRIAALNSLRDDADHGPNVVSIFDFEPQQKSTPVPAFNSVRSEGHVVRLAA